MAMHRLHNNSGVTFIEVVMAIIISGILITVAFRSVAPIAESNRVEETKSELDALAIAIAGNSALESNGVRSDFGYVGDVGALPPNLDALVNNPGGFATWNGPYINKRFVQISNDQKQDAWGATYSFNGNSITSTGSGSSIVKQVANSNAALIYNPVSGNIYDSDGTPPGDIYMDSVLILLTYPNGAGGYTTEGSYPDIGGYFSYDSIPIGNHQLQLIYIPTADTLKRFISVTPSSSVYNEYYFSSNNWYPSSGYGGGGLVLVNGSEDTYSGSCNDFAFDLTNNSGTSVTLSGIIIEWNSPEAYYQRINIGSTAIFNNSNPRNGSAASVSFSSIVITNGETVTIQVIGFKNNPTGGQNVDVSNIDFTITFSDGSIITLNSGSC